PAELVETHRGRDAKEPSLDGGEVDEVVGPLDGPRDSLLAQVIGIRAPPGHAVAVRPEALAAALDGGVDDRGAGRRHGSREQGRPETPRRVRPRSPTSS